MTDRTRLRPDLFPPDPVRPAGLEPFRPPVGSTYKRGNAETLKEVLRVNKDAMPGGVMLMGVAHGLGAITKVTYDARFNALILDDRAAYFLRLRPVLLAALCRAIAADPMQCVGVSLGRSEAVLGKLDPESDIAWDLKLLDQFLGDLVFANIGCTRGYKFADNVRPKRNEQPNDVPPEGNKQRPPPELAVVFMFDHFNFVVEADVVRLSGCAMDIQIAPVSSKPARGGYTPLKSEGGESDVPAAYEHNADRITHAIQHYRKERIVERAFLYAEAAAVLRKLDNSGFDLAALAAVIENR